MAHIDYYLFPISPFTYLAGQNLEAIASKTGATITYKPFNMLQVFEETGGVLPAKRHPNRQAYRLQELERVSKRMGLPMNLKPAHFPTNPVPASSAIIAAQKAGGGDLGGLVFSLLRACWAEDKNIAEDDVIAAALEANGFAAGLTISGMVEGSEVYAKNTNDALEAGVFGAPTYVVGDQVFWGQDRLDYLEEALSA